MSVLAVLFAVLKWLLSGPNFLVASALALLVYVQIRDYYNAVSHFVRSSYEALMLRIALLRQGYMPSNVVWSASTALQRWSYEWSFIPPVDTREHMSIIEMIGWLVLVFAALKVLICGFKVIRLTFWYVYSRLQVFFKVSRFSDGFAEKMMPGSFLESVKALPSFQGEIWVRTSDSSFYKAGQCFLTKYGLLTAYHVVEDAYEVRIVRDDLSIEVSAEKFQQLEGDVGIYKLTDVQAARLHMTRAKLNTVSIPAKAGLVVRVQAFGNKSMGLLESDENFGISVYKGSTVKGFSGAPYCVGKTVYGMHLGGATTNLGFEAAYLAMLCHSFNEDTEDFLMNMIENGKEYRWQRSPYDPDEIRVNVDGRYFTASTDLIGRLSSGKRKKEVDIYQADYEQENLTKAEDLPMAPRGFAQYDDSEETTSKNLTTAPASAGATGKEKQVESVVQNDGSLDQIQADLNFLKNSLKRLSGRLTTLRSTLVQPNDPSPGTSGGMKNPKRRQGSPQRKNVGGS